MKVRPFVHLALLAALLAGVAQPLAAETGYVPVVAAYHAEGVDYETALWISNLGTTSGEFSTRFIPFNSDGTVPPANPPAKVTLPAGGTFFLRPLAPKGARGLLEVIADPGLVAVARLVTTPFSGGETLGASVPLVTSKNLIAAGQTAALQGIERDAAGTRSHYGLINLGTQPAACSVSVFQAGGTQILQTALLQVPAMGEVDFYDALQLLGVVTIEHARINSTCDQPFYPYVTLADIRTGEVAFLEPSLHPDLGTGSTPPPPPPPDGSVRFTAPGVFHSPTPNNAVKRLSFTPPPGLYAYLRAQLDVKLGPWSPGNPSGTHNIFWMVRSARNADMFGYVNVKGPNSNSIFVRHGFNQTQSQKARMDGSVALNPGATYHFDYLYDAHSRVIELIVSNQAGFELVRLRGTPNANNVRFDQGETLVLDFGFPQGLNPNEPATYGWDYKDLVIDIVE